MTTKIIPLTQDKFAIIDEVDFELASHKWYYSAYTKSASRRDMKTKKLVSMHRVIMDSPKGLEVDHINGNRLDNRRANLRICTHAENSRNTKLSKRNTSGYKGVVWDKQMKAWRVRIAKKFIGLYKDKYEAILTYEKLSGEQFKEFKRRIIL